MYDFKTAVINRAIANNRRNALAKRAADESWGDIAKGWLDKAKKFGEDHKWVEPVVYGAAGAGLPWLVGSILGVKPKTLGILSAMLGIGGVAGGLYRNGSIDALKKYLGGSDLPNSGLTPAEQHDMMLMRERPYSNDPEVLKQKFLNPEGRLNRLSGDVKGIPNQAKSLNALRQNAQKDLDNQGKDAERMSPQNIYRAFRGLDKL